MPQSVFAIHLPLLATSDRQALTMSLRKSLQSALAISGLQTSLEGEDSQQQSLHCLESENWVSLFDRQVLSFDDCDSLLEVALNVSAIAERPALAVFHNEFNDLAFLIFEYGRIVDGYESSHGMMAKRIPTLTEIRRSAEWEKYFCVARTEQQFRDVFEFLASPWEDRHELFSEFIKLPTASKDSRNLVTDPAGRTSITAAQPASQRGSKARVTNETKSPLNNSQRKLSLLVGEQHVLSIEFTWLAREFENPIVRMVGRAIDDGMLSITQATAMWFMKGTNNSETILRELVVDINYDQHEGHQAIETQLGMPSLPKTASDDQASKLLLTITVAAVMPGDGEIQIAMQPRSDRRDAIQPIAEYLISVAKPHWLPLGLKMNSAVKAMNTPRVLFAVAILRDDASISLPEVVSILQRWLEAQSHVEEGSIDLHYEGLVDGNTFELPRREMRLESDAKASEDISAFVGNARELQSLFITRFNSDHKPLAGASIQRPSTGPDETLHISLWTINSDRTSTDKAALQRMLVELVDTLIARSNPLHAWLADWDWIPRFSTAQENGFSPYEEAHFTGRSTEVDYDLHGGFLSHDWCATKLRGMAALLWLGPPFLEKVDFGRAELVTERAAIGAAERWTLKSGHNLNELELVLEQFLPRTSAPSPFR